MAEQELWGYAEIASHLGVGEGTVRGYRHRGLLPEPDVFLAPDRPRWYPATIRDWHKQRPGRGARTDLKKDKS